MSPDKAERRPKGVRIHTRRLVEQARRDPDFDERALPLLRQKIQDFDSVHGAHLGVLRDVFDARKEKYETGNTDKLNALMRDYESLEGRHYDPKHPEILLEVKDATDVIVGLFNRR